MPPKRSNRTMRAIRISMEETSLQIEVVTRRVSVVALSPPPPQSRSVSQRANRWRRGAVWDSSSLHPGFVKRARRSSSKRRDQLGAVRPAGNQICRRSALEVTENESGRHRVAVDAVLAAGSQAGPHPGAG